MVESDYTNLCHPHAHLCISVHRSTHKTVYIHYTQRGEGGGRGAGGGGGGEEEAAHLGYFSSQAASTFSLLKSIQQKDDEESTFSSPGPLCQTHSSHFSTY